jgi:hypothetical protein
MQGHVQQKLAKLLTYKQMQLRTHFNCVDVNTYLDANKQIYFHIMSI